MNQRGPTWPPQHIRSPSITADTVSTWRMTFGGRSFTCMSTAVPTSSVVVTSTVKGFHSRYASKARGIDHTSAIGASISMAALMARAALATRLHAVEQVGLLRRELLLGDQAPLAQVVQLLDLLGDRRTGFLRRHLLATAAVHAVRVPFHLPVDLVLHDRRLAHVLERLRAALAR